MPNSDSEKTGRRRQTETDGLRKQQATHRRGTSSFEARFGRVILEHGIAAIPAGLFHFQRLLGLDAKHLWFVAYILSCKWDADLPYPSLNKMERCTGVDIQALYRYKKVLISQGYLQVYRRLTDKGGYDTDAYDFSDLFDRLEECIIAEQPQPNPIRADVPFPGAGESLAESGEIDSSFVARYGRVIVRYGVAAIPRGIFTYQRALGLTPQQVWFIGYILSFKWDAALPYPSIEKMSVNTGYNRAYLHEIKASLVKSGYLRLVHRTNELGGQDTNAYDFSGLLDAIRAQLDAAKENKQAPLTGLASEANLISPEPEAVMRDIEPAARRRSRLAAQARASKIASQKVEENQSNPGIIDPTGVGINGHTHPFGNGHTEVGISGHTPATINQYTPPGITRQTGPAITGQRAVGINKQTDPVLPAKPAHLSQGTQRQVSQHQHELETIQTDKLKRNEFESALSIGKFR